MDDHEGSPVTGFFWALLIAVVSYSVMIIAFT